MKNIIIALIIIILIGVGGYFLMNREAGPEAMPPESTATTTSVGQMETGEMPVNKNETVIGSSVQSRPITAYHYGNLDSTEEVLFVGGIHGGYEWNTALVAYELMDYFRASSSTIPSNLKVTVIPALNPDGIFKVTGKEGRFAVADVPTAKDATIPGRFNGNNVDLNRNFDCDWQAEGKWQQRTVSGGSAAFSEPESLAIKNYVESKDLKAVVVYYSAAGGVFASNCHTGVLPETTELTNIYAKASGYPAYKEFNFYEITGDMVNWLAKKEIPAISVLLTNHTDTEWTKNKAGVDALLKEVAN